MALKQNDLNWFRPLWRRVAVALFLAAWLAWELLWSKDMFWALLVGAGFGLLIGRAGRSAGVAAAILLGAMAFLTWEQTKTWRDSATLWRHAASCGPEPSPSAIASGSGSTSRAARRRASTTPPLTWRMPRSGAASART